MTCLLDRRTLLVRGGATALGLAGATRIGADAPITVVIAQEATPDAAPVPVATLPEPTDDGIDLPILGIAFGSEEIVATPEVPAGTVRLLTAVPYEDFGSIIFRIPDDQPDAIDQLLAYAAAPEGEPPTWLPESYFPGGMRTDNRYGTTAEGFVSLIPGRYGVVDFATAASTTFVAKDVDTNAIDPKDLPLYGASYTDGFGIGDILRSMSAVQFAALDSMTYTGLDQALSTGRQLWQLTNEGGMVHNIYIFGTPEGITPDDILNGILNDDGSGSEGSTGGLVTTQALSPGGVNHFYLDLAPGPYAAMCTESDFRGPPHFFMGMIVTFEVA